jgi:hypothetical protein
VFRSCPTVNTYVAAVKSFLGFAHRVILAACAAAGAALSWVLPFEKLIVAGG